MDCSDKTALGKVLTRLGLNYGRAINDEMVDLFYDALQEYDLDAIRHAASQLVKTHKHFPVIADFIDLLDDTGHQHLGADKAWSVAIRMLNDDDTVIATDEIRMAWAAALPVLQLGDEIGARMAFRDAYNRMDKTQPPKWNISPGNDARLRRERVVEAVRLGRLESSVLVVYPDIPECQPDVLANNYLAYQRTTGQIDSARKKLRAIRDRLTPRAAADQKPRASVQPISPCNSDAYAHQLRHGFVEIETARQVKTDELDW